MSTAGVLGLLPGWNLEQWADHILRVPRSTIRRRRAYYSDNEIARAVRRLEIPYGRYIERFGRDQDGRLLFGSEAGEVKLP